MVCLKHVCRTFLSKVSFHTAKAYFESQNSLQAILLPTKVNLTLRIQKLHLLLFFGLWTLLKVKKSNEAPKTSKSAKMAKIAQNRHIFKSKRAKVAKDIFFFWLIIGLYILVQHKIIGRSFIHVALSSMTHPNVQVTKLMDETISGK